MFKIDKSFFYAIIALLIGLLVTNFVYQNRLEEKRQATANEFNRHAVLRARDIQAELNRSFFQVDSIANLFASSEWVSSSEYEEFVKRVFPKFPKGRRISVMSHIGEGDLDAVISQIKTNPEEHFKNFQLFDLNQQTKQYPATPHKGHYTFIQYSYPKISTGNFYGRNMHPSYPIGPQLFQTIEQKQRRISALLQPVVGVIGKPFFLYMTPIITRNKNNSETLSRIVISSQPIERVFANNSFSQFTKDYQYIIQDELGNQFHYPEKVLIVANDTQPLDTNQFHYQQSIETASAKWQFIVRANEQFYQVKSQNLLSLVFLGLLSSTLISLLIWQFFSQQINLENKVYNKTSELNRANHELEKNRLQLKAHNQQLENALESAQAASKAKSEFLATMSHEIRTPMNGVIGMLGMLARGKLNDQQLNQAKLAQSSAESLLSIINDILDFSKIEAGKLEFEAIDFNLIELLQHINKTMSLRASEKNLALTLDISELNTEWVNGDPGRVRQIINNLLSNAIKFTEHGKINISGNIKQQHNQLLFSCSIEDTGMGIPADKIDSLFDSFTQVDASTTREYGGTGLGLTIVNQLCDLMDGRVDVISTEGKGSIFTFSIRLNKASNNHNKAKQKLTDESKKHPTTTVRPINSTSARILLVEDDPINQLVAEGILEELGYSIEIAQNGQLAIDRLSQTSNEQSFDLVFMDCQMPVLDGYEATRQIRSGKISNLITNIPIVAMTANAMKGDREKCLDAGMDDYISKPIEPEVILEKLNRWLKPKKK